MRAALRLMDDERPLNILIVAAEAAPFAKSGGLADVAGSLPQALRALGHDARLMLPDYALIDNAAWDIHHAFNFIMAENAFVRVNYTDANGVPVYFLGGCPWFCADDELYYGCRQDAPRFIFFSQAVASIGQAGPLSNGVPWIPDVIHANDWHTGILPFLFYLRRYDPHIQRIATLYTIHNIAYQGDCAGDPLRKINMPPRLHPDLVRLDKTDNLMATGMAYADAVNTVSPRYARELEKPEFGFGLDEMVRIRAARHEMFGVLNGIDIGRWNPATDPTLAVNYDAHTLERRTENKRALQIQSETEVRDDAMVIGMVSRLVEQKGLDLVFPAMWQLLRESNTQFIVLGVGRPRYIEAMRWLENEFPGRVRAYLEFSALPAERIYAGCDAFIMPSRYEPCGIGQMIAMRYGALPLVRATGGLADTVINYDDGAADKGTGFVFHAYTSEALLGTLRWALHTYLVRHGAWQRMQRRAMRIDFSWDASAREYVRRYRQIVAQRQQRRMAVSY